MLSVFRRGCVRAGIEMGYSRGYNPHPKLSLPLPRTVGIECDDDLLCIWVEETEGEFDIEKFKMRLIEQLPAGCEIVSAETVRSRHCPVPRRAVYKFALKEFIFSDEQIMGRLRKNCEDILASERIVLRRQFGKEGSKSKDIDVRGFLRDIELIEDEIVVECNISEAGTIRLEEIMQLLDIKIAHLGAAVRRAEVHWQLKN